MPPASLAETSRERWFLWLSLVFMALYYPVLIRLFELDLFADGSQSLFRPVLNGMTFNSMMYHLLAGRFDVDPGAIGNEMFIVDGRAVSYFGIFCALIRLVLAPFLDLTRVDVTRLSSLVAVMAGGYFQLKSVLLVRRCATPSSRNTVLTIVLVVCILLGGPQVQFLRPSIYQEVVDWALALAMMFVYLAIRGLLTAEGFSKRVLASMAMLAGLALITRVSFGLGLYLALGGLLLAIWWRGHMRLALVPGTILSGFIAIAGIVNYERWGNPLTFADFSKYGQAIQFVPDWLTRQAQYGEFNPIRLWFGLLYYFLPIWVIVRPDGRLLFEEAQTRLINNTELPASSFLITDPLLIGLAVAFFVLCRRANSRGVIDRTAALAMLAGLAVPVLLMMSAISMNFRYRAEFYPFLMLGALLGFRLLCREAAPRAFSRLTNAVLGIGAVVGISMSHVMAALYMWSPWGTAQRYIVPLGWEQLYGLPLQELIRQLYRWI